jgi:hypothetical protein
MRLPRDVSSNVDIPIEPASADDLPDSDEPDIPLAEAVETMDIDDNRSSMVPLQTTTIATVVSQITLWAKPGHDGYEKMKREFLNVSSNNPTVKFNVWGSIDREVISSIKIPIKARGFDWKALNGPELFAVLDQVFSEEITPIHLCLHVIFDCQ